MVDHQFADAWLAGWYDAFCPWEQRDDFDFYLPLIMSANAVLDVGCGTGMLLHGAREAGHSGRLCGLDPAEAMLEVARQCADVEWVRGYLTDTTFSREFDLVVMTGHAFQVLVTDDEVRTTLAAVRSALTQDGRFAFETRNPAARAWEQWTPEHAVDATSGADTVRLEHRVEAVDGELVWFVSTYTSPGWNQPRVSRSTLRFLDPDTLSTFLNEAGLAIDEQFGDWDRSPVTATSPEIITIARRQKQQPGS